MKKTLLSLFIISSSMLYCAESAHPTLKIKIPRLEQIRAEATRNPETLFSQGQKKETSPRNSSIIQLNEPETPESFSSVDSSPVENKKSPQYSPVKFVSMREPETPGTSPTITLFGIELQYRLQRTGAPKIIFNPGTFSYALNEVYIHDQGSNSTCNKQYDTFKKEASKEFLQDPNNRMIIFAAAMFKQLNEEKNKRPIDKQKIKALKTDLEVCELNIMVDDKIRPKDTLSDLLTFCDEMSSSKVIKHEWLKRLNEEYYKPAERLFRAAGMRFKGE